MHIHTKYEVYMIIYMEKIGNQNVEREYVHIQGKYKVSRLSMWIGEQMKEKYQNGYHLTTTSQND